MPLGHYRPRNQPLHNPKNNEQPDHESIFLLTEANEKAEGLEREEASTEASLHNTRHLICQFDKTPGPCAFNCHRHRHRQR